MIFSTCCSWDCVALLMFIIFDCHGDKQIPTHHSVLLCFVLWTFTFHSSFLLRLWWHHQHFLNLPHFLSGHLQLPECCSASQGINEGDKCKGLWYIYVRHASPLITCRLTGGLVAVQDIQPVGEQFQHFALEGKQEQRWSNNDATT